MDEVGRGTTMKDGLAIAFATIHHLVTENQTRCLFATHFHELSDMLGCTSQYEGEGTFRSVRFFCTGVEELSVSASVCQGQLLLLMTSIVKQFRLFVPFAARCQSRQSWPQSRSTRGCTHKCDSGGSEDPFLA
jgi:MutS domain V